MRGFFPSLAQINSYPRGMDFPDIHFQSLPGDDFYTVTAERTPQEPELLSSHSDGPYCGYICTCTLQYLHFLQIYWKREEIKRTLDILSSLPIFSLLLSSTGFRECIEVMALSWTQVMPDLPRSVCSSIQMSSWFPIGHY